MQHLVVQLAEHSMQEQSAFTDAVLVVYKRVAELHDASGCLAGLEQPPLELQPPNGCCPHCAVQPGNHCCTTNAGCGGGAGGRPAWLQLPYLLSTSALSSATLSYWCTTA